MFVGVCVCICVCVYVRVYVCVCACVCVCIKDEVRPPSPSCFLPPCLSFPLRLCICLVIACSRTLTSATHHPCLSSFYHPFPNHTCSLSSLSLFSLSFSLSISLYLSIYLSIYITIYLTASKCSEREYSCFYLRLFGSHQHTTTFALPALIAVWQDKLKRS